MHYSEVRQPLDAATNYLKHKILADVDRLVGNETNIPNSNLYTATPQFQSKTRMELLTGKANLGVFALASSHHVLTQLSNLSIDARGKKVLSLFGIKSLSGIESKDNLWHKGFEKISFNILDWLSVMINAHVDVAKDPYIIRLNVREFTMNVCTFLLRAGMGERTFYFLPQQILKDIAVEYEKYAGYYGVSAVGNPNRLAIAAVKERYIKEAKKLAKTPEQKNAFVEIENSELDITEELMDINFLRKQLDSSSEYYKSFDWYYNQLRILKLYNTFEIPSRSLSELTSLSQIDTKKYGKKFDQLNNFIARWKRFLAEDKVFLDKLGILEKTFLLGKFEYGVNLPLQAFKNFILSNTDEYNAFKDKLLIRINKYGQLTQTGIENVDRMLTALYKSNFFYNYIKSKDGDSRQYIHDLLYGANSIVSRFSRLKSEALNGKYPELLDSNGDFKNILFRVLLPRVKYDSLDKILPDYFELKINKTSDEAVDDLIIRAWEELMDSDNLVLRQFAEDLAIYSFLTSGDSFGKNNFFKWCPNSLRDKIGYFDYMQELEATPSKLNDILNDDVVLRSLWWDDNIIPTFDFYKYSRTIDEDGEHTDISYKSQYIPYKTIIPEGETTSKMVPEVILDGRSSSRDLIGNAVSQENGSITSINPIYQPYKKLKLKDNNDPRYTFLYKYVGIAKDSAGSNVPVYVLVNKLGVNNKSRILVENDLDNSALPEINSVTDSPLSKTITSLESKLTGFKPIYDVFPNNEYGYMASQDQTLSLHEQFQDILNYGKEHKSLSMDEITEYLTNDITGVEQTDTVNIATPTFTFEDGTVIKTPFKLNDEQVAALKGLEEFANGDTSTEIVLQGFAGTGKTVIIGLFNEYLSKNNISVVYSSPTNRANHVLESRMPNAEIYTLDRLCGLASSIDFGSENYNVAELRKQFNPDSVKAKPGQIVIIDEASMMQEGIYEFVKEVLINQYGCKVIYVGDNAQLRPVKSNTRSVVFDNENKISLTKVERTDSNAILRESTRLRNGEGFSYTNDLDENGNGIMFDNNGEATMAFINRAFSSPEYRINPSTFRMIVGTNTAVQNYNKVLRSILYNSNELPMLVPGELLTGYTNKFMGKDKKWNIVNSEDYVINELEPTTISIELPNGTLSFKGYRCKVTPCEGLSKKTVTLSIIDSSEYRSESMKKLVTTVKGLNAQIREQLNIARNSRSRNAYEKVKILRDTLTKINDVVNTFEDIKDGKYTIFRKTFDYGYALTVHKSQGSTFRNVGVDVQSINSFKSEEVINELKYVAVTRAANSVIVFDRHAKDIKTAENSSTTPTAREILTPEQIKEANEAGKKNMEYCGIAGKNKK